MTLKMISLMCFSEIQNTCLRMTGMFEKIFEVSSTVWPVQIILYFCDNIFYTITYCTYRPLGSQLRKSIIAARHVLTIKFASIYSDAYGLSTFELLPFLSWRVLFNLFSYSFTLCSLPVTPFSRFIFIAIYYPSKKRKEREGGWKEKKRELKCHQKMRGGDFVPLLKFYVQQN